MIVAAIALAAAQASDGPIGKFDDSKPDLTVSSTLSIYAIERCLINTTDPLGPPMVYEQPDMPGKVTMLWVSGGTTQRRIDLQKSGTGTRVTGWNPSKRAPHCLS